MAKIEKNTVSNTQDADIFEITLTRDWSVIPIKDAKARKKAVEAYLDKTLSRYQDGDKPLPIRADLEKTLNTQLDLAAGLRGVLMAFLALDIEGVPVDATLTVYEVGLRLPIADVFARYKEKGQDVVLLECLGNQVLRRESESVLTVSDDAAEINQLKVEYWLNTAKQGNAHYLVFTSTYVEIKEALLEMFDVITVSALEDLRSDAA
ncbi:MAG: hypothetical protein LBC35_05765 [Coriobacteriales bacterium]|jgi:hypothetical protein|nr:hypothetical protein [Coriobacteriales bacterium]